MLDPSDEQIVTRGPERTVAYAIDKNGDMPARDYLESTGRKRGPSAQEAAGLLRSFEMMAAQGKIVNDEKFKKERGEIFGFKKYQVRVGAFLVGRVWYLTHGFRKKTDKWKKSELDRADRIRQEYLERMKGNR